MQIEKSYGILKRDRLKSVGAEEREDRTMKIMAVDFGDSRTGIAICDRGELLASPVCVIEEKHFPTTVKKTAEQAQEQGIAGEKSTPFLLSKVCEATGGASLRTNVEIVRNNARVAAIIAKRYYEMKE